MLLPARKTRWTYDEYRQMADVGFFREQRVELIDGEIIEMPPMKERHAAAVVLVQQALLRAYGDQYIVRPQLPLHVEEDSEPEPDISVVRGRARDFLNSHPSSATLVVEVSDTTLAYDVSEKASLYARAGLREYWVINLIANRVEVLRDATQNASQPLGHGYATVEFFTASDEITPPDTARAVRVADLLP